MERVNLDSSAGRDSEEYKLYVLLITRKIAMFTLVMEQSRKSSLLCSKNVGSTNDDSSRSQLTGGQPVLPTRKYDTPSDSDSEEECY